jgi:hypothetical protein
LFLFHHAVSWLLLNLFPCYERKPRSGLLDAGWFVERTVLPIHPNVFTLY